MLTVYEVFTGHPLCQLSDLDCCSTQNSSEWSFSQVLKDDNLNQLIFLFTSFEYSHQYTQTKHKTDCNSMVEKKTKKKTLFCHGVETT